MQSLPSKQILYINIVQMHLTNNNLEDAERTLKVVLDKMNIAPDNIASHIPLPLLNIMISLYLKMGKLNYYLKFSCF